MAGVYSGVNSWLPAHDSVAARLLATKPEQGGEKSAAVSRLSGGEAGPLPADRCVPPGRLTFDLGGDEVPCYAVMTGEAFAVLKQTGRVNPNHALLAGDSGWEDPFAAAYDWMRWQMHLHLDGYDGGLPMWVWARTRRRDLVNTVRTTARNSPGSVLVTLQIPRRRLLLTDYLYWHDVLNGLPSLPLHCPNCGAAHCDEGDCLDTWLDPWLDAWDARVPRSDDGARLAWWSWPASLQAELFRSWDIVREIRPHWPVQGCVESLRAEWVAAATFVASPKTR